MDEQILIIDIFKLGQGCMTNFSLVGKKCRKKIFDIRSSESNWRYSPTSYKKLFFCTKNNTTCSGKRTFSTRFSG